MSNDDDSLICPITQDIFRDPVLAEDGRLYEREAITRWIIENGTSPFTRQALNTNHLQPDEVIRKKADQRRRLSVTYNRESDQVKLPPIRCRWPNRYIPEDGGCESIGNICSTSCLRRHPNIVICICLTAFVLIPSLLVIVILFNTPPKIEPTFASMPYQTLPPVCYALNHTLTINSCMASFTNITYIKFGTCNDFSYQRIKHNFIALSSYTTIIFAFQQTFGYWDIDDITLWDHSTNQNIFQNCDFESGSLLPSYSQCQSARYISNSSQLNGVYCYTDRTNGSFGYLMQNVSITVGSRYYLWFYLQNRNGSGSRYMVLLGS